MTNGNKEKLDRKFDRLAHLLPSPMRGPIAWLRAPSARFVRIPCGILLIFLGFLGFLPILGFWMVPLGVLLLAQDIPFLQRPTRVALTWIERKWLDWRRKRKSSHDNSG